MPKNNKIHALANSVINKIAAGEVVERPASVVKELVENSIDSGADNIIVVISNSGKDLIKVTDNGCGMSVDDAVLSLQKHTTSKINHADDLFNLNTLGFRGEALASISSVSKFYLITNPNNDSNAIKISFDNNQISQPKKAVLSRGTEISVENLFYNLPARKKFLKSVNTELKHIVNYINYQALQSNDIDFKLIHNKQLLLNLSKTTSKPKRLFQLFYENIGSDYIPIQFKDNYLSLEAYLIPPKNCKSSKSFQYIYINGRFIKHRSINMAFTHAYHPFLRPYQNSSFFCFITLHPSEVDFNVHPAKTEARLRNDPLIYTIVQDVIVKALKSYSEKRYFSSSSNLSVSDVGYSAPQIEQPPLTNFIQPKSLKTNHKNKQPSDKNSGDPIDAEPQNLEALDKTFKGQNEEIKKIATIDSIDNIQNQEINDSHASIKPNLSTDLWQYIGLMPPNYLLAHRQSSLFLINLHCIRESLLYEQLATAKANNNIKTFLLDEPILLELNLSNALLLDQYLNLFNACGLTLSSFGQNTFQITDIPSLLINNNGIDNLFNSEKVKALVSDILEALSVFGKRGKTTEIIEDILKKLACACVDDNKQILPNELSLIFKNLDNRMFSAYLPHNQAIMIKITMSEIKKRFGV